MTPPFHFLFPSGWNYFIYICIFFFWELVFNIILILEDLGSYDRIKSPHSSIYQLNVLHETRLTSMQTQAFHSRGCSHQLCSVYHSLLPLS
jgi:hypothetical protein